MSMIIFGLCLDTADIRVAHLVAGKLQKRYQGQRADFTGAEHSQEKVKIVCNIYAPRLVALWQLYEIASMEAGRFGVGIVETEVFGELPVDCWVSEAAHFLKIMRIENLPL